MYWSTVPLARASSSKTHGTDTIEQKISNDLPWKKPPRQVINYYIAKKARPAKVLLLFMIIFLFRKAVAAMAQSSADDIEGDTRPDEGKHHGVGASESFVEQKNAAEQLQSWVDVHEDTRQRIAGGLNAFGKGNKRRTGDDASGWQKQPLPPSNRFARGGRLIVSKQPNQHDKGWH